MIKLRNKSFGQYVIVPKTTTKDKDIKLTDRGMILTLLSLPDNWNFTIRGLQSILPDGRLAIENSLKRLEELGYITRYQERDSAGLFLGNILEIHDRIDSSDGLNTDRENVAVEPQMGGSILRNIQDGAYVTVPMTSAKDKTLKLSDRGMLLTLLSLPNNWRFTLRGMATILPDGKAAIATCIHKLEDLGYITKEQIHNESGGFSYNVVEIHDKPISESERTAKNKRTKTAASSNSETTAKCSKNPLPENRETATGCSINPPPESRETVMGCSKNPLPENPYPENLYPENPYPVWSPQSNNNKVNTHLVNPQVSTHPAANATNELTYDEFMQLVSEFSKEEVDYQIQKIRSRNYKNCMNAFTIRAWCQEARTHITTTHIKQKKGNSFNNFNQRQYDYSALEQQLLHQ